MKGLAIVIACVAATTTAAAADLPRGGRYDSRIQHVNYNPKDVVVLKAVPGIGVRVVFASNERILDVASGFSQGWEVIDRRNVLYIKPKSAKADGGTISPSPGKWNTNLMVSTDKRMYDFDLRLLSARSKNVPYRVEFSYPGDETAKLRRATAKQRMAQRAPIRNWAYTMQVGTASSTIAPTMAYDDGRFTYLKFPNNREFPAAFLVAEDKSESLVNSHVEKDVLVLHRVAPSMVLRLGKAVVGIYNEKYDADGVPPIDGTTVPGVQRITIGDTE